MKIVSAANKEEMSRKAAQIIVDLIHVKPSAILGLATGSTPEGTYRFLADDRRKKGTDYQKVRTVNLDEYAGLKPEDPNSYHAYMEGHFFRYVNIPSDQHFLPNGTADSLDEGCKAYDRLIERMGGVDLQLLGIGRNGHIGFNEPGTPFDAGTHVVKLTESTRQANARFFGSIQEVPEKAITMGIGTILKSKAILLLASGPSKAEAIAKLLSATAPDTDFPASALLRHPNVTVIADTDAMSLANTKAGSL
ncbi:glucosamine-6-phosphate deaminase [Sporolactobacillus sp. CQH2019]|uniref:glucosamine-6-phosphate deaminase n=1 Tax=Sporolactobacillus sp. CQH2019 TaxID=3023512 RepID=UPI002368301E|nr:glucosamine-6-phosphate deaminase [Sporolactobacillus sp. CQH2019]MDD9149542.1 glucosamine-6-phosphate deaminase [Sporolactobacillus sp. CQH2019]